MKKKVILIILIFIFVVTSGFGCKLFGEGKKIQEAMKPINLTFWGVWDNKDDYSSLIESYKAIHPNISIEYRKYRYNEYESELLNALAEDRGPDIFMIQNSWVKKYQNKLEPLPVEIEMAYPLLQGTIQKELVAELKKTKSLSLKQLADEYVDVIYGDVVIKTKEEETKTRKDKIFALPLFVDTLAMYYNKDLFNNAGIAETSPYWDKKFQQDVKKLTKQNTKGQIIQSGVALGGSHNIERATDILSALMMQNGTVMINDAGTIMFNQVPPSYQDKRYNPGLEALRFYTDFVNPAKEVYSWNKNLDNSLEMFIQNKLAIMFGYSYNILIIKARAPKLNFSVEELPQIEGNKKINYANYWVLGASKKSSYTDEVWDFIQFMAKEDQVKIYLEKTRKLPALKSLLDEFSQNPDIGVFVDQVLTAKSWYKGAGPLAAEEIMLEMIDNTATGKEEIIDIINLAAARIQQTINQ